MRKDLLLLESPPKTQTLTSPGDEAAQGKESVALGRLENTLSCVCVPCRVHVCAQ